VNVLGVYLWSNKTLYSHVPLKQLPDEYEPDQTVRMPSTSTKDQGKEGSIEEEEMETTESDEYNDYKNYTSPEQLAFDLVTLSLLPESRWKNLVNLDIIRVKKIFV
jgi:U3 small nucleolar RNA-associated protein 21